LLAAPYYHLVISAFIVQVHKNNKATALTSNFVTARLSFLKVVTKLTQMGVRLSSPAGEDTKPYHRSLGEGG
jgi:hypothetical protein